MDAVKSQPKLLYLIAEDQYFCNHRFNLAKAAQKAGFQVALATHCTQNQARIEAAGITVFSLKHFSRSGMNPLRQLLALRELYRVYRDFKPSVVHHVAIKPLIWGSVIAKVCRVPKIVNALGGLGYVFTDSKNDTLLSVIKKKILQAFVLTFLRGLYSDPNIELILQNPDDIQVIQKRAGLNKQAIKHIAGAGIDLLAFPVLPNPVEQSPIVICCVSRMLWDKGIGELVDAARILKQQNIPAIVVLYGMPDPENPASIPRETLEQWAREGVIEWRGFSANVAEVYQQVHIAVLPSYREGLPKSLLEAASCGRPIVTTDVPGCREVVEPGVTGFLVPLKNAEALAASLIQLCQNEALRLQMGQAARKRMEQYFSDTIIHEQTIALYISAP